jgi:hypothetical protein
MTIKKDQKIMTAKQTTTTEGTKVCVKSARGIKNLVLKKSQLKRNKNLAFMEHILTIEGTNIQAAEQIWTIWETQI